MERCRQYPSIHVDCSWGEYFYGAALQSFPAATYILLSLPNFLGHILIYDTVSLIVPQRRFDWQLLDLFRLFVCVYVSCSGRHATCSIVKYVLQSASIWVMKFCSCSSRYAKGYSLTDCIGLHVRLLHEQAISLSASQMLYPVTCVCNIFSPPADKLSILLLRLYIATISLSATNLQPRWRLRTSSWITETATWWLPPLIRYYHRTS